jgi:sec-independent protein translocase protein TatB
MFGIGMPEMLVILAIALIVIGPKKLPDLAKSLGRAMREFKKATSEFKESIQLEGELSEVKETFNDISDEVKGAVDLNLKPEKPKADNADPIESNDKKSEEIDSEHEPDSDDLDDMKNLKKEFDNQDDHTKTSPKDESIVQEASTDTDNDKNDKIKGPVDDA